MASGAERGSRVSRDGFHNPYHFVPVKPFELKDMSIDSEAFRNRNLGRISHSRYEGLSGRIVCRLTSETPMFIGAGQEENTEPRAVHPSVRPGTEEPMIPASSLRGLIASVAEAASNSSLRILAPTVYSYRKSWKGALSAMGLVLKREGQFSLLPLTLPLHRKSAVPSSFQSIFRERPHFYRVYVGNYGPRGDRMLDGLKSYRHDRPEFYYMAYDPLGFKEHHGLRLGKTADRGQYPLRKAEYDRLEPDEKKRYIRGIMYVLGGQGREMPHTKKHEYFLPYPEEADSWPQIPISPMAVERFESIAEGRTGDKEKMTRRGQSASMLPFEPRGTLRNETDDQWFVRLKHGDVVYFLPKSDGTEIEEISFSSIWRSRTESRDRSAATAHTFFGNVDPCLLPPGSDGKKTLTPAELLFGFVSQADNKAGEDEAMRAYAGRLRFSFGRVVESESENYFLPDEVVLKILDAPKPPSPSLYFTHSDEKERGSHLRKDDLSPEKHIPQGRKFYLHQIPADAPWKTKNSDQERDKQKAQITPWRENLIFYFHVDFDNLSKEELGLVCYALRPSETFRHKLGMGKPIGLGSVRIDPVGLLLVDRKKRYSNEGLGDERYHDSWVAPDEDVSKWPLPYRAEKGVKADCPAFEELREGFSRTMDTDIRHALELIGNPESVVAPVHYPQMHGPKIGGAEFEQEHFRWFTENDRRAEKEKETAVALEPMKSGDSHLPTLPYICMRTDLI